MAAAGAAASNGDKVGGEGVLLNINGDEQQESGYIVSAISAVGSAGYSVVSLPGALANWGMSKAFLNKEKAKSALLEYTTSMRHNMMANLKDVIVQGATSDPDMWKPVKRLVANIFDAIWEDVETEIEGDLESALLGVIKDNDTRPKFRGIVARIPGLMWLRAKYMHAYLPHNKSFFGKTKAPIYLLIFAIQLIPNSSVPVLLVHEAMFMLVLFFHCCAGPPDLFQLVMYVQSFKAYLFLTGGVVTVITATQMYFHCYTYARLTMADCVDEMGPASLDGTIQVLDWAFSIILPWLAFIMMPFATNPEVKFAHKASSYEPPEPVADPNARPAGANPGAPGPAGDPNLPSDAAPPAKPKIQPKDPDEVDCWEATAIVTEYETNDSDGGTEKKKRKRKKKKKNSAFSKVVHHMKYRGNNMLGFLKYDAVVVVACLAFLARLTYNTVPGQDWSSMHTWKTLVDHKQFLNNLFWVRCVYCFLMVPYFLLSLPMVGKMVTHTKTTGYNDHGAVVFFEIPYVAPEVPSTMDKAREAWAKVKERAKKNSRGEAEGGEGADDDDLTYREVMTAAWIAVEDDLNDESKHKAPLTQVDANATLLGVWDRF